MESWKVWTKCFFKSEKPTYSGSGMRFADWISFHELSTKLMYLYNFFPGSHFKTRLFHFTCNQHILWLLSIWRFLTWHIFKTLNYGKTQTYVKVEEIVGWELGVLVPCVPTVPQLPGWSCRVHPVSPTDFSSFPGDGVWIKSRSFIVSPPHTLFSVTSWWTL